MNWYQLGSAQHIFEEPGDHAGELETSSMMHIAPQLVMPLNTAGSGKSLIPVLKAFREGKVQSQRPWTTVSNDTGIGDPSKSF